MSPVASTRHSPEHTLLSICSEKFPDIPRCSLPAPDTPGHFLHPPAVFHLRLPLDSPPLKIACNDLPRYHPPAEVFRPSPFKWFFFLLPSFIKDRFYFLPPVCNGWPVISLQGQSNFAQLPERHTCIPAAGLALPGDPASVCLPAGGVFLLRGLEAQGAALGNRLGVWVEVLVQAFGSKQRDLARGTGALDRVVLSPREAAGLAGLGGEEHWGTPAQVPALKAGLRLQPLGA